MSDSSVLPLTRLALSPLGTLFPQRGEKAGEALSKARSLHDLVACMKAHNPGLAAHAMSSVAIFGAGPEGQRLAAICQEREIKIAAVVDDDPKKLGVAISGTRVEATSRLAALDRAYPVIVATHRALEPVQKALALGFTTVAPFAALQVLAPDVFRPHMFYQGWLEDLFENRDQYRGLESELADARSRQVLDAVIQFRLTADPLALLPVLEEGRYYRGLYHPTSLFELGPGEIYVDAGAYDGDSVRRFIERVEDRYARILAFEPDPQTYARLKESFAKEPRVQTFNAGLHRHKAALRFRNDATRGAIFTDDGDCSIDVVGLDDVLAGAPVSYIKMNIEGAEIDALYGARKTIECWTPKLAISVYHRASDLWQIPQIVRELSPRYELYLRQHDGGVIETVLYAIHRENEHA
jgi:FkbM family methyltransferase